MNSALYQFLLLSSRWRYCLLAAIAGSVVLLLYQNFLQQQINQINRYDYQLVMLENRLDNYLKNRTDIVNKKRLYSQQSQQLNDFEKKLKSFDFNAPEQNVLLAAKNAGVQPVDVRISTILQDNAGKFYLIEITINDGSGKISQFLNNLIVQPEFAVWEQLTIIRHTNHYKLTLAVKYYFELFDKTTS